MTGLFWQPSHQAIAAANGNLSYTTPGCVTALVCSRRCNGIRETSTPDLLMGRGTDSSDDDGIVEPRVGPSFQAEVPAFEGMRGTADTGRHDDVLLWHPDAATPQVVDVFLRQAEQAIGDPRLVGSVPEFALKALYQAGGDPQRASDALTFLESQHAASLWSEEETAELQDSVTAHGTNLRRVHAGIANLSTRSFPECVSQHALSVEKRPLPMGSEPSVGGPGGGGGAQDEKGGRSAKSHTYRE
jgi:hypothetical protein